MVTRLECQSVPVYSLVHRYDEMAEMVSEIPDETEALVELQRYYRKAS